MPTGYLASKIGGVLEVVEIVSTTFEGLIFLRRYAANSFFCTLKNW